MRIFLFSLFLFLLFDNPQGSTLPSKRSLGELNTTLKADIDGNYQIINPCTQKEIRSTSFEGSHEFCHHASGENWSDYSQKCSAIIKGFLQAIGNLVRFDSTPNGNFNFHINTSITHKEGGHCDSKESQSCCPIPTIIIEATGSEIPSTSCNSPSEKEKNNEINISRQQNSTELITIKPNLTSQGENTSCSEDSKTIQDVAKITEIPAQDGTPKYQAGRFQGKKSWTPENVTPTETVQTVLPFVPQRSPMETTTTEASAETFTEISKPEQNSDMHEPPKRPTTQPSANYVTNSLTLLPEGKFTSPAPPPPDTLDLGNPSGFASNIPEERDFVPQRISQPTAAGHEDEYIPNQHQPAPVGIDQPPNDNSRQLFSDELRGQTPVNQQPANSFPSPDQIPVTNFPSADASDAFTHETQLERPFAYPVASTPGEPQPVELPFSKPPLSPRAPAAGPPAPNYPKHFPNHLRKTTPFPPTIVKPEFDELPGQGLVTRPPLTKNDFFNAPEKPFPHDQRPELQAPLPPTQSPVINTDSQGLTKQTLPINQHVHPDSVAFDPKDSSKFSAVNNRNHPNRPHVFHDNQPTRRNSQPQQQFATETVDMNRFPTNTLPKPAFGPNFRERPVIVHPLNPFEHLATPKMQTPSPQFTASPQTPPEPLPQPTPNLDIPQPKPTLPYEDEPPTTPAPELRSSVEETNNRDAVMPNSDYINPRIPAPFPRPEPQLKSPMQFPPTVLPQQAEHFNKAQPPRTTTPEPSTTVASELTPSSDYDYQYPNYEGVDYDYPVHQSPKPPQNPGAQFYPRARAPFRRFPPNFFLRQHPMRNPQMRYYPHNRKYKNNMKFINTTVPENDYQYMHGVAPEQTPNYDYPDYSDYPDYPDYPQFPANAPHRRLPPNFFPQRHQIRNLKRNPFPPHLGKSFQAGIPTSVELNPVLQHNSNGRQSPDFINPSNILKQPEIQFIGGVPPSGTLTPEEFQKVQPVLTTTAHDNETLTTEFQTTPGPEYHPPQESVHQTAQGIQQVLDRREQQPRNFNQPELQLGKAPVHQTFPPRQPPMRNFEAPQPQPVARKFENETISPDFQTTTGPSVELNNQNIRDKWVGQMPNSHNPGQEIPKGFFHPGHQPFRGGAPFRRGFPVHQQPIRNFRPVFTPTTPEDKSEFQSTKNPEFDDQSINRRNSGQNSNFHFAGQIPNTFSHPQPQFRGKAHAVPPIGWGPSGVHPSVNVKIGQPGPNPPTFENESRVTVQPEFQPEQDNLNTKDRRTEKIPDSYLAEGHVQNQAESPAKDSETPTEPTNQHTDGKPILPSPVSDFRGHQTPNLGHSELLVRDNRHPGQIFPLKQQPMNFEVPQSRHGSEEKPISRDFQIDHRHQPHVEHDSRHIGNRWTGQRPNFQFRGQQVPNIFPQHGQQFRGGVPFSPSFPAEQQKMRILENAQPQFTTAAYEDVTTAAPEHQSSLEPHQSASIEQQTEEIQNLGPGSDSQPTKPPSGEFPSVSSTKQGQDRNFQISQPRPISGRTYEEGTFKSAPQPSHENVNDRTVSDSAKQQHQNNFDQSRLNAPSRQFPSNISPQPTMETSEILQPNPPTQPPQKFQAPVEYNRGMPNLPFRNPQNPRPFLRPNFPPRPNAPFHEFPSNFFPQQHPMRNIQMGPPGRIHKNETIMAGFQKTKPETPNYENDRRPNLPNHDFTNQQSPNAFGRPESQVRANFHGFPPGMHQKDRHDDPPFDKRPPIEFPSSVGLGRIPESVPGPFSDTRTANRFVNPPNNNQPETALMHSDRNLDYDIPTSFYNSRPTPNEKQPEPQPDLIPGVRTSDEYLSATSSDENNTISPPLPNTSVDYEDEENAPSAVSPYPGQVLNDNVTTPKPNTAALYSEQITPIISSPRWQPPADISTSEYKNSLHSQPPITRPKPLQLISTSESTVQAFGGDQPPVIPVRKEFPSDFSANPDGNVARAEGIPDIHEKPIERNNPVSMPRSNSFVPGDSTSAFSFQHQNQPFLNTPGKRPLVNLGTTPPHHIDTIPTKFEPVTSNPQPIYAGGPQKFSPETLPPPAPFIPSNQLPPTIENPITNQPLGPPKDFAAPVGQSRVHPVSRPSISTPLNFNQPEQQKPFENLNLHVDGPHPLAFGPPKHPIPSSQPVVPIHQQHNQPQYPYRAQRTPERNFNSQQMQIPSQPLRKPEVPQRLSGIPPLNRQSHSTQSAEVQKMAPEQPKWDAIGTTTFPPQSQPNRQNFNSVLTFPPVDQHTNARPQADSLIQAGSEVEPQSVISASDQQPPVDFSLQRTPFKHIPAASPQLPQPSEFVNTNTKISNQQQFDVHQRNSKSPQTPPKLTTATYEEVTATTDSPQPTHYSGIPVQLLQSPVNAPTKFPDKQDGNPDFVHPEFPPPVTEATSSQMPPPYVDEINPTSQTNFEPQYARDKISTNFPPAIVEPQPQPSFAYTGVQNYKTAERPVPKLKPKTLPIAGPQNEEDFTNAENSNQLQSNLNIPTPAPSPPDQHYTAATSLQTSEMAYNPIVSLREEHDKQPVQDSLEFIDNSPQSQPTTAVKYPETIQTAEYEPSLIPRPQPQTALNNSGRQTEDNSANVWADQQQKITSSLEFGVTPPMTYDRIPQRNLKNIDIQPNTGIDSQNHYTTPQTLQSKPTETYKQEIITTDDPHPQAPQSVLILGDKVSPRRNPFYNHSGAPQSIRHETALNPNQQIAAATGGGRAASQIAEYPTAPSSSETLDRPAPLSTPESFYTKRALRKPQPDSLVLVPPPQEHPNSETTEEIIVNQKPATVSPPEQSVTKIPDAFTSTEHKSVTLGRHPPTKTKIAEEIVTTKLPKNIVNSSVNVQLAFAEKLLNYEDETLPNLQQVTTPSPIVENSSRPPTGSSSNSEQIPHRQIVFGESTFSKNFGRDNEQPEGSSPPNHISTSTPQRPQQVIIDNPTSSFDDYDQQHSTRSPDMFPKYDEIPPNFNARTGLTKGHPDEKSHVTFPMQPSAALPQLSVN